VPFKSKAQARLLFAKNPKVAKEFASKTKSFKKLPEKVGSITRSLLKKRSSK